MHQKFILNYLVFQIKSLRKELKIREEVASPALTSSGSPLTAKKSRLAQQQREENKDFEYEYKLAMEHNQQNYRNIRQEADDGADGDQKGREELMFQALLQAEERHHEEARVDYHENEKRREQEQLEAQHEKQQRC